MQTASDGATLRYRLWRPPAAAAAPRGLVIYLHGIQSHGRWYLGSGAHLAAAGFAVAMPDRRGSGMNAEARGDCPSWEQLARDVTDLEEALLSEFSTQRGRPPLALVAVSWGTKLAAALAAMHHGRYAAMALLGPGICPKQDVPAHVKAKIIRAMICRRPTERFDIPLSDPHLFTDTPRWLEFLGRDGQSLRRATARFMLNSRRLDDFLSEATELITCPTLVILGQDDRIADLERTRRWLARIGSLERSLVLWRGAAHTLEFEPEPQPIFDRLAAWLAGHCTEGTRP